ncbi:hypothetical protein [Streptomyces fragilis]|uniref:Uncharacterized protein n=1 Tax=Streptomyces fragilis TaxID=67301 RepID=A0ABV2YAP0_9ACTN|nr:hypothetical protein [Streptomyces fragilis]
MAVRPSQSWRDGVAEEIRELEAGTLDPECACMTVLFPEPLTEATEGVLAEFEAALAVIEQPTDAQVFASVERVVLALNAVNERFGGAAYETDEREELCDYIDETLSEHGIDVPALTARHGMGRYEVTSRWRDW